MANQVPKDNNGVIIGDKGVLVVDAGINGTISQQIQQQVRELTEKPIRYVVNTTYHGDHTFGNYAFPEEVTIISSRRNKQSMDDLIYEKRMRSANLAHGKVHTLVYPSFYYVYPDRGDQWIDADSAPVQSHVIQQATIDAEAEVARFTEAQRGGVVLRLGNLYGPEVPSALEQWHLAQKGFAVLPGPRDAYLCSIWAEDGARAIVTALTEAPAGVYDIVDDEPLTREAFARALADGVGKRRLFGLPQGLLKLMTGAAADMVNRSQRVSNRRFKEVTDWTPAVPNAKKGWKLIAQEQQRAKGEAIHD